MSKVVYSPLTHFFVDHTQVVDAVPANKATDAFGPVDGSSTSKYRVTSIIRSTSTTKVPVFAITNGQVLIQPLSTDNTKINIIIKPNASFAPLKIKFFIYRGLEQSDLMEVIASQVQMKEPVDPLRPILLQNIWDKFLEFNEVPIGQTPVFLSSQIGFGDGSIGGATLLDDVFLGSSSSGITNYQIPECRKGDLIGYFKGTIGLDIVLDHGDYQLENEEEIFRLDLNYARQAEQVFDTSIIADPDKHKKYKEYIHQFLDASAFWGSHIDCGKVELFNDGTQSTATDIYSKIITKFQTKNNIYLYLKSERGRSYNYYNNYPTGDIDFALKNDTDKKLYETTGWPITIKTYTQATGSPEDQLSLSLEFDIDSNIHETDRSISIYAIVPGRKEENFLIDKQLRFPNTKITGFTPTINIIPFNNFIDSGNSTSISSFLFFFIKGIQDLSFKNYFDDLWKVNVKPIYDVIGAINLCQWVNNVHINITNFSPILGFTNTIINQRVIFDTGKDNSGNTKARRLYIANIVEVFNDKMEDNIDLITIGSTSGFEKNLTQTNYSIALYKSNIFSVYRGKIKDGTDEIYCLSLVSNADFRLKHSYLHLGISEEEYNQLNYDNTVVPTSPTGTAHLPSGASNIKFHLEEDLSVGTTENFRKFRLGLLYEDNKGELQTPLFPTAIANQVYVYTIDGFYFCSNAFAQHQEFSLTFPKALAEFNHKTNYKGEYGFDWMRLGLTTIDGDNNYKNHIGKLYDNSTSIVVSDSNRYKGATFNKDLELFKKLELEYFPFPVQHKNDKIIKKYYTPILTIYPPYAPPATSSLIDLDRQSIFTAPFDDDLNRKAEVELNIEIISTQSIVDLDFDTTTFNIAPLSLPIAAGIHTLNLTITCLKEFSKEKVIKVISYDSIDPGKEKIIGITRMHPNAKSIRRAKKVLFITVKTKLNGIENIPSANSKALFLKKYLRQVLISPIIDSFELDLTSDATFTTDYTHIDGSSSPPQDVIKSWDETKTGQEVHTYLYNILKSQNIPGSTATVGGKYDDYFKLFFIEEDGGYLDSSGTYQGLNGYSSGKFIVGFASANNSTATHEFLHSANLPHSFAAYEASIYAKYTYEFKMTDNIMDYSHYIPIDRVSLWNWQGRIAREASDIEP